MVAVTQRLTARLYMPKYTLIRNNCSLVDEMYVVHSGKAMVFGRHTVQLLSIKFRGAGDVMGDDIRTLLVGDRLHRRRHFTAKAAGPPAFVLNGDTLRDRRRSRRIQTRREALRLLPAHPTGLIIQTRAHGHGRLHWRTPTR